MAIAILPDANEAAVARDHAEAISDSKQFGGRVVYQPSFSKIIRVYRRQAIRVPQETAGVVGPLRIENGARAPLI